MPADDGEIPLGVAEQTAGVASPRVLRALPKPELVKAGSIRTPYPVTGRAVLVHSQMDPSRAGVWSEEDRTACRAEPYVTVAAVTAVIHNITVSLWLASRQEKEREKQR